MHILATASCFQWIQHRVRFFYPETGCRDNPKTTLKLPHRVGWLYM